MLEVILYSFLAGVVGTMLGGIVGTFFGRKKFLNVSIMFGFASGVMLAMVCCDLLLEAVKLSNIWNVVIFTVIGFLIIYLFEFMIIENQEKAKIEFISMFAHEKDANVKRNASMGVVVAISIALHNLPEGMIIGANSINNNSLAYIILIAVHNIPEGIAMAVPLIIGDVKVWKTLLICFLSGIPTIIGASLTYWVGAFSNLAISICLSVASGAMLYVIFVELLYNSYSSKKISTAVSTIVGLLFGLIIIYSV